MALAGIGQAWVMEVHIHPSGLQLQPSRPTLGDNNSSSSKTLTAEFILQLGLTNDQLPLQAKKCGVSGWTRASCDHQQPRHSSWRLGGD